MQLLGIISYSLFAGPTPLLSLNGLLMSQNLSIARYRINLNVKCEDVTPLALHSPSGGHNHRSEPNPTELAAAPAIYWLRIGGVCPDRTRAITMRTRWLTERNALAFQRTTTVIKSGSNGTSHTTVVGGR